MVRRFSASTLAGARLILVLWQVRKWQVKFPYTVIDCLPICYVRRVYKYRARRRPLYLRFISSSPHYCAAAVFSIPSPTCQAPKPTSPRVPARGRGRIRFLENVVSTARWTSSSHYARCSPISIDSLLLLPSRRQLHCKDVYHLSVIRFHILSVPSTRSRELDSNRNASLIHISVIHVVSLFLVVGINLCIAKLLLFPTQYACGKNKS